MLDDYHIKTIYKQYGNHIKTIWKLYGFNIKNGMMDRWIVF
jgi:hypothetical protein